MKIKKFFSKTGVAIAALVAAIVAAINIGIARSDFFESADFGGAGVGFLWVVALAIAVSVCGIVKGVQVGKEKRQARKDTQQLNGQNQKTIDDKGSRTPNFQKNNGRQYQYNTQSTYRNQGNYQNKNSYSNNGYNRQGGSFEDKINREAEKLGEKINDGANKIGVKIDEIFGNAGNNSANPYSRTSHDGANPYSSKTRTSAKTGGNYYGQHYNPSSDGDVRSGAPGNRQNNGYYGSGNGSYNQNVQTGTYYQNSGTNNTQGYSQNNTNLNQNQSGIDESAQTNYFNNEPGSSTYRSGPLKKK